MKVTKMGHCCLLIETGGLKILTDPGNYTTSQNELKNVDVVLITHEHADHFHMESLKTVLKNNPQAQVITNKGVGIRLEAEVMKYTLVEHGQEVKIKNILIQGLGEKHQQMYKEWGQVDNTGYFIASKLFYPGDALFNPNKEVEILALPVAGPWMKLSEAIDYALEIKPKVCFPVHDGGLKAPGVAHRLPNTILPEKGINFVVIEEGKSLEFT